MKPRISFEGFFFFNSNKYLFISPHQENIKGQKEKNRQQLLLTIIIIIIKQMRTDFCKPTDVSLPIRPKHLNEIQWKVLEIQRYRNRNRNHAKMENENGDASNCHRCTRSYQRGMEQHLEKIPCALTSCKKITLLAMALILRRFLSISWFTEIILPATICLHNSIPFVRTTEQCVVPISRVYTRWGERW